MSPLPAFRIFLSPPDVGDEERRSLLDAFDSNWIAPLGPDVDAFEQELAASVGVANAVALSSGTAALHLALISLGVGRGDVVITSTLTFAATANAIAYVGATPLFVDVDASWQLDPELVQAAIEAEQRAGRIPAAVITVDLYGTCADYDAIHHICAAHGIPIIEDAAEALGATYKSRPAGSLGDIGVFSFNGNKIITTSGGGMLVTDDPARAEEVRHLATQAREPGAHYEHHRVGYNYRLSNLLAALGRAQLRSLDTKLARRRAIYERYLTAVEMIPGISLMPRPVDGTANHWLTCVQVAPEQAGCTREDLRLALTEAGIEARPVWKPLHRQDVWRTAPRMGGETADRLFDRGLCLPSGSTLRESEQSEIIDIIRRRMS